MPRSLGGTYSLPALNPVTTGTVISSTWANNTLADIASEIENSLARSGEGGMAGPLRLEDGTSGNPSLAFNNETNSGLYRAGAGDVRIQVAATHVLTFAAATVTIPVGLTVAQDAVGGNAVTASGNAAGAGVHTTGGSSGGSALVAVGGATSGAGVTATGGAPNGIGVLAVGDGTGHGVNGTGGDSSAAGVKGTGGATDGAGVSGQGTGSGAGVAGTGGATSGAYGGDFTGGTTNGAGLRGTGVGSGLGVYGVGGATNGLGVSGLGTGSGAGVLGTGGATDGEGVFGQGTWAGAGIHGVGGANNGIGIYGVGGAPNGTGMQGQGTGNGSGGKFANAVGSTSAAAEAWSYSAASAGAFVSNSAGWAALQVHEGHAYFSGSSPALTAPYVNTLTPLNLVKAWGLIHSNGSGGYTIEDGFNLDSVSSVSSTSVVVYFAADLSWDKYAVILTQEVVGLTAGDLNVASRATDGFTIKQVHGAGQVSWIHFVVLGRQ